MDKVKRLNEFDGKIEDFDEVLGNEIYEAFMEDDNYFHEIGRAIGSTFNACTTEREVELVDRMLAAICGWSINTLLNRIEGKDNE